MYVASASFDLQLKDGEILQYCKSPIASVKNNHALVEQSFQSAPLGEEDLKHHILQSGDLCVLEKTPPEELFSVSLERSLSGTTNQNFCCQTSGTRLLDLHDTPIEHTKP